MLHACEASVMNKSTNQTKLMVKRTQNRSETTLVVILGFFFVCFTGSIFAIHKKLGFLPNQRLLDKLKTPVAFEEARSVKREGILLGGSQIAASPTITTSTEKKNCECISCEEDELCGGLWKAERFPPLIASAKKHRNLEQDLKTRRLHVIVSHCESDLEWLHSYTEGFNIASLHIVSKCNKNVSVDPGLNAMIETYENVGRCDHTYAYYLSQVLDSKLTSFDDDDRSIVVFLKDKDYTEDYPFHQSLNFTKLLTLAASKNGFGCVRAIKENDYAFSAYHEMETLALFRIKDYKIGDSKYGRNPNETLSVFHSPDFNNLGSYLIGLMSGLTDDFQQEVVPVCYTGYFAASLGNIKKQKKEVWNRAAKFLSRADNIAEGHFMERLWAMLLSTPLESYQIKALKNCASKVVSREESWPGRLLKAVSEECDGEATAKKFREAISKVGQRYVLSHEIDVESGSEWRQDWWEDLPEEIQEALLFLGWDKALWNLQPYE